MRVLPVGAMMTTKKTKAARRTTARTSKKTKVVPTAPLARAIRSVINKTTETKYVSQIIQSVTTPANFGYVREVLSGTDANTRLRHILPNLSQGVGSNQRIGTVITPIKVRVTVRYFFDQPYTNADRINVRQYVVTNKMVKTSPLWETNSQIQQSSMVEVGNGTNTYPDFGASPNSFLNASRHINKATFTPLKGCKDFVLQKQAGYVHGAQTSFADYAYSPYFGAIEHTEAIRVKCPKLKYEQFVEAGQDNYQQPTNFCPLWGAVAWNTCTEQSKTYRDQQGEISGSGVGKPAVPIIRYTIFSEMWFKDD